MLTNNLTRNELENGVCDYFTNKYGLSRYPYKYKASFEFYSGNEYYKNNDKTFKGLKKHYLNCKKDLSKIRDNKQLDRDIQAAALFNHVYDDLASIEMFNKNVCHSLDKIKYGLEHAKSARDAIKLLDNIYSYMLAKYKRLSDLLPGHYIIVFDPYEYGIPARAGVFDKKHMILGGIYNPLQYKEIKEFLAAIQKVE